MDGSNQEVVLSTSAQSDCYIPGVSAARLHCRFELINGLKLFAPVVKATIAHEDSIYTARVCTRKQEYRYKKSEDQQDPEYISTNDHDEAVTSFVFESAGADGIHPPSALYAAFP